jgi:hypothetical protein
MISAIKSTQTASFNMKLHERIKGNFKDNEYIVKVQSNPYKLYLYSINPNPGTCALLVKGENNDKALIHPNSFPYFNLSLSPYNSLVHKDHHFSMWEVGFRYIGTLLEAYLKKDSTDLYKSFSLGADVVYKNDACYQFIISRPEFAFVHYTVLPGENVIDIGKNFLINDNMILENNKQVSGFYDVKPGQIILVPTVFAKKIIFYIDKDSFLPLVQEMYDDKGLYSKIEFSSLVRNPKFAADEFTRKKKEYGF